MIKLTFKTRFMWAVALYVAGFGLVYFGFLLRLIACVYSASLFLGVATSISMISMMSYMKFFPDRDYVVFVAFLVLGSILLSLLYMLSDYLQVQIYNVLSVANPSSFWL